MAGGIPALLAVFARANVDMAIDYHTGLSRFHSDWLKETIYHELSHASHYTKVGTSWYSQFVNAELAEIVAHPSGALNPYGDGHSSNSPIIALGEAWAYHMGHFLADQRYGVNASCIIGQQFEYCPDLDAAVPPRPNIQVLENFDPNFTSDPFHWIPNGLMEDLMDDRNDNNAFPIIVPLNDQVQGYTISQMFNALQADVTTLQTYHLRLISQTNNNPTGVNTIFSFYGY